MRTLGIITSMLLLGLGAPASADPVVVTHEDTVQAQPGRDYARVATLPLDPNTFASNVTASGKVVLGRYGDRGLHFRWLDPATGRETYLPAPGKYPQIEAIDADAIWYSEMTVAKGRTTVFRYDRHTQRMRSFVLPEERERDTAFVIGHDGNTIWYGTTPPVEDHVYEDVWSVRFGRPATLTSHGRRHGGPTYGDGILAWTQEGPGDTDTGRIVLREVETGATVRTAMPTGCSPTSRRIQGNGDQWVVVMSCEDPEQEAVVLDRTGAITTILRIGMEDGAYGTEDRGVFFYDLFYDFTERRLLDYSDSRDSEIAPASGPGAHPLQVWPQRGGHALVVRLK